MGLTSSQHQPSANMSQRNRIVFGPSRSPTPDPEDNDMAQRNRVVIGPSMSPTPESEDNREAAQVGATAAPPPPSENVVDQPNRNEQPGEKRKRKKTKEKHAKSFDSDTLVEEVASNESPKKNKKKRSKSLDSEVASQEASAAGDEDATIQDFAKKSKKKRKSRKTHPEPEEDHAVTDKRHPASRTDDVEQQQQQQPSPKRKKKRSKKNPTHDSDLPRQNGPQEEGVANHDGLHGDAESARGDALPERTSSVSQNPTSAKKKRSQGQKPGDINGTNTSDAQEHLVSHAIGGLPPSAQPSSTNGTHDRDPGEDDNEDDVSFIPDSQQQPPQRDTTQLIDPSQIKREPREDSSDLDEDVRFQFTGIAANFAEAVTDPVAETRRENDPESGLGWLHKRDHAPQETPLLTARGTLLNAGSPDLQPNQVKSEPQSDSHSNSDNSSEAIPIPSDGSGSHSPSVQRLERMSRSRSRSVSRAPSRSGFLADQTLGLVTNARPNPYEQVPYSSPSSLGSNRSIPARLPSPSSTGSERSVAAQVDPQPSSRDLEQDSGHDAPVNPDDVDIDQPVNQEPSSSKARTKKAALGRKKKTALPASTEAGSLVVQDADMIDANTDTPTTKTQENNPRRNSHSDLADMNIHLMANGLSSPSEGTQQPEADRLVQHEHSDDELPLDNMSATSRADNVSPTNQPSKTKRRQSKSSLDLENGASGSGVATQNDITTPEPTNQSAKPINSPEKRTKKRAPRNTASVDDTEEEVQSAHEGRPVNAESSAAGNVATRNNSVEPEDQASQPQSGSKSKGKKKRVLGQTRTLLSLSQMEGDEIEDDFAATFPRRRSAVQPAARDSNGPDQSQIGGSQALSPEQPRKPKRKRRSGNNASEDEMESMLAAGPSKGRKASKSGLSDDDRQSKRKRRSSAKEGKATGLSDDDRQSQRKRRSSAKEGKATGPWTQEELNNLGKVVNDFMEDNDLTQHEVNQLVHAVPSKADSSIKDLWVKAEQAIPQRTRKQIMERARRIYHNFVARGTWTQEQKEEVHELFETHPKKWAEIAGMINRDQRDVRDYWRNTYLVLESQVKSRWSKDEEERLREVVEEALSKIRITRENSDEPQRKSRSKSGEDEAMIDWQQISAAMDLTRSRQQCRWKWIDMREKGLVGDDSISLPTQTLSSAGPSGRINGISEELANAREDYRGMGPEEKYRLIDAIKDSGAREEKYIPWRTLVDERFRTKWHRPVLRLVWYRLRQTVPNYQDQDVEANARFLVNYYHMHRLFPRFDDNAIDEQAEETVVQYNRGKWVWKRPSGNLRAVRERQRRSSSASSRASSRLSRKVSSEILNLSDDEDGTSESRRSAELGEERGRHTHRDGPKSDEVSVNIPGHLKGEAAKKALAQARAKSKKGKAKDVAEEDTRRVRSNSVAIDSDSE